MPGAQVLSDKTRVVIYARYSSDQQRDASIEDQIRMCRARVEREGWTFISAYTDHAISGASRHRPAYRQLLEDARAGIFDIVVAEALDRLSRDQEDTAALYKRLSFSDVKLITLAEGEISELQVGFKGTMNSLFLKDLAQKTRRGLEGRVRDGKSGGGLSYGYDIVKEYDARGEPVRGGRTINEDEAAIVRRVFREYNEGLSPRNIAQRLNQDNIPGPGGRPWNDTTIRGHALRGTGLLHNELYIGRIIWNRLRYLKDPQTGKRISRLNPPEAWITTEAPELRIIDEDVWANAQSRMLAIRESPAVTKSRESEFWLQRRPRHLLTGLAVCGACGGSLAAVGRDYLACSVARRQGNCANKRSIRRGVLEGIIVEGLRDHLMSPELVAEFTRAFTTEMNNLQRDRARNLSQHERELAEVDRSLNDLVDALAQGFKGDTLRARMDTLEARRAELTRTIASAPAPAPLLHPNLAELYRRKVAALTGALADPEHGAQALEIVRGLVDRVAVYPRDKGYEVELTGAIAQMVSLAADNADLVGEPFASSVKVVAGAGFEPDIRHQRKLGSRMITGISRMPLVIRSYST